MIKDFAKKQASKRYRGKCRQANKQNVKEIIRTVIAPRNELSVVDTMNVLLGLAIDTKRNAPKNNPKHQQQNNKRLYKDVRMNKASAPQNTQ